MTPILLYDIDGTLLRVDRTFLFNLICEQLADLDISKEQMENKSYAGRTDRGIFLELIGNRPDAENLFQLLKKRYITAMIDQLKPAHVKPIREAVESVKQVKDMGIPVGLCTGNFREVAYKKVETAGLDKMFPFGGFGCHHKNRNNLPRLAHLQYRSVYQKNPSPQQYVIIGDTPSDIRCAKHFGTKVIAVTTGRFTKEELNKYEPDLIIDSLENPRQWLGEIGF